MTGEEPPGRFLRTRLPSVVDLVAWLYVKLVGPDENQTLPSMSTLYSPLEESRSAEVRRREHNSGLAIR